MFQLILNALVPVAFVVLLGYFAGRGKFISAEGAKSLSTVVINFALPCALFVSVFGFSPSQFENIPYVLTLVIGLTIPFFVGFSVALVVWKKAPGEAALFGSNSGYPDMAYFGVPIALTVLGPQGMLPVIVGNIISSFIILPVIMAMLHKGNDGDVSTGIGTTLRNTIKQPIIWAPLLALALMLLGVRLPSLAIHSLNLIGDVSGGLALFTLGILLSFLTPRIDKQVVVAVFLKNLAMPALVLLLALFFKLDPVLAKGAVIIAACPAATMGAMLSSQFDVAQDKIPAQILVSTVTAIVTMAMWIYIAEKLF